MSSFFRNFLSFFSKYGTKGYVGGVLAVILSIVAAFFSYLREQNDKISNNAESFIILSHNVSTLSGKVEVLESDSKTHVTQTSFNHYVDHSEKERDTQAAIDRASQKELGELIRGQQDLDRIIYNSTFLHSTPKGAIK